MAPRTFTYALHIVTTPEKLWAALTQNEFWQQYWNGEWQIESEWQKGSSVHFSTADGKPYSVGEVLESDPPNTLVYTWPNPETLGQVPPEKLTWKIASSGPGTVRLQLLHEDIAESYFDSVGLGWAAILSSLKTLLESGTALRFHPRGGGSLTE